MTAYNVVDRALLAAGQPEDITVVLANLDAIAAVMNGNLDSSNIASLTPAKLTGYPADGAKVLKGDSSWGVITPSAMTLICDAVVGRGNSGDPAVGATGFDTNTILGGNIPGTYKHLRLYFTGRSNFVTFNDVVKLRANNDSGANYSIANTDYTGGIISFPGTQDTATGVRGGSAWVDFIDYTGSFYKNAIGQWLSQSSSGGNSGSFFGEWKNTVAITRIAASLTSGGFIAGSRFTLYGIN